MQFVALCFAIACLFQVSNALHFYTESGSTKCFFEELPKGTIVVGKVSGEIGHEGQYEYSPMIKLDITVDETFDNDHRIVTQKISNSGDFTFSALDSGEHKFCITPRFQHLDVKLRVFFDLVITGSEVIDSRGEDEVSSINNRVKELSNRLNEILREQKLSREREANFRDQSENTNSKVVWWSLIQIGVLGATGYYQLRHLKQFFIKQKVL